MSPLHVDSVLQQYNWGYFSRIMKNSDASVHPKIVTRQIGSLVSTQK